MTLTKRSQVSFKHMNILQTFFIFTVFVISIPQVPIEKPDSSEKHKGKKR